MRSPRNRVLNTCQTQLASLADAWREARISRLDVAVNPNLRSTLARWIPPSNVLEISTAVMSRGARAIREIITHEAAHVVVWNRSGRGARPHGQEWSALMRAAGFEPRATLVRCGFRNGERNKLRIRHFCSVCQFSRIARRRMPRWRCPECRAIGLEGRLEVERVSSR
jgi:predicted SprT family Zn-dependent metalloprotease